MSSEPWILKTFQIDTTGASGAHLLIEARGPGLTSFLLNLIGLDTTATLKVTRGSISFKSSSMRGLTQTSTALTQIGSFQGGYSKPISYLFLSVISFIAGISIDILILEISGDFYAIFTSVGLIFSILCIIMYALKKNLMFGFETSGGAFYGLTFKRGILNGVSVDIEQVEITIAMVNALIGSASLGEDYTEAMEVSKLTKQGIVVYDQPKQEGARPIQHQAAPQQPVQQDPPPAIIQNKIPAPPNQPAEELELSPDGKWMWDGEGWVPTPSSSA